MRGNGDNGGVGAYFDGGCSAFAFKEGDDALGGVVAEELSEGFFVVADVVALDEVDHVCRCETSQRGLGKMGVAGEEIFRAGVQVGEVAATAAGDEDFSAGALTVFEQEDTFAATAGFEGAHHAGSAGAEDDDVEGGRGRVRRHLT